MAKARPQEQELVFWRAPKDHAALQELRAISTDGADDPLAAVGDLLWEHALVVAVQRAGGSLEIPKRELHAAIADRRLAVLALRFDKRTGTYRVELLRQRKGTRRA